MKGEARRFQFQVDWRAAAPVRDTWDEAAHDAVSAGYAVWVTRNRQAIKLNEQANIARMP